MLAVSRTGAGGKKGNPELLSLCFEWRRRWKKKNREKVRAADRRWRENLTPEKRTARQNKQNAAGRKRRANATKQQRQNMEVENFQLLANLPVMWQWTSRELTMAANALWEQASKRAIVKGIAPEGLPFYSSITPVLLLYGYAIENKVKAIDVVQNTKTTGERLNKKLLSHNLRKLLDLTTVRLSDAQNDLKTISKDHN